MGLYPDEEVADAIVVLAHQQTHLVCCVYSSKRDNVALFLAAALNRKTCHERLGLYFS